MNILLLIALLGIVFCKDGVLIGHLSIDKKLLANITGYPTNNTYVKVGSDEVFSITVATTTPYRWNIYTPNDYPFIKCRQKIIEKSSNPFLHDFDEVLQIFTCKAGYQGNGTVSLKLGTMDPRLVVPPGMKAKVHVNFGPNMTGPTLKTSIPETVPTIPPPNEVPKLPPINPLPPSASDPNSRPPIQTDPSINPGNNNRNNDENNPSKDKDQNKPQNNSKKRFDFEKLLKNFFNSLIGNNERDRRRQNNRSDNSERNRTNRTNRRRNRRRERHYYEDEENYYGDDYYQDDFYDFLYDDGYW